MIRRVNPQRAVWIAILGLGSVPLASWQAASSTQGGCDPAGAPTSAHPVAVIHGRSIRLTWHASAPASKLPGDKVIGYNVYRWSSLDPTIKQLNSKLCETTAYTDADVTPGIVYYYVTRGVSAHGMSAPSNQAHAEIRHK